MAAASLVFGEGSRRDRTARPDRRCFRTTGSKPKTSLNRSICRKITTQIRAHPIPMRKSSINAAQTAWNTDDMPPEAPAHAATQPHKHVLESPRKRKPKEPIKYQIAGEKNSVDSSQGQPKEVQRATRWALGVPFYRVGADCSVPCRGRWTWAPPFRSRLGFLSRASSPKGACRRLGQWIPSWWVQ